MSDPDSIMWPVVSTLILIGEILVWMFWPIMRLAVIPGIIVSAVCAVGMIWYYIAHVRPKKKQK